MNDKVTDPLVAELSHLLKQHSSFTPSETAAEGFFSLVEKCIDGMPDREEDVALVQVHNNSANFDGTPSALFTTHSIKLFRVTFQVAAMVKIVVSDMYFRERNKNNAMEAMRLIFQPLVSKCILAMIPYAFEVCDADALLSYSLILVRFKANVSRKNMIPQDCHPLLANGFLNSLMQSSASTACRLYIPWPTATAIAFGWESDGRRIHSNFDFCRLPSLALFERIVRGLILKLKSGSTQTLNEAGISFGLSANLNNQLVSVIHRTVMEDYSMAASTSKLAEFFEGGGEQPDWLQSLLNRGQLDLQVMTAEERATFLEGYVVPDDHQAAYVANRDMWDALPSSFTVKYISASGSEYCVKAAKNVLKFAVYSKLWSRIDRLLVLPGMGGREGSFINVSTTELNVEGMVTFPIGNGPVLLYPVTIGPLTPEQDLIFRVLNLVIEAAQDNIVRRLSLLPEGEGKRYYPTPINLMMTVIAPSTKPGFGGHRDSNPSVVKANDEDFSTTNLPTRGEMMTPTLIMVPPEFVGKKGGETKYVMTEADEPHREIKPVGPGFVSGSTSFTGNVLTGLGPNMEDLHGVATFDGGPLDDNCPRVIFSGRFGSMPGPVNKHTIYPGGIVAPSMEARQKNWLDNSTSKFKFKLHEGEYRRYHKGNFGAMAAHAIPSRKDYALESELQHDTAKRNALGVPGLSPDETGDSLPDNNPPAPPRRAKVKLFTSQMANSPLTFEYTVGIVRPMHLVGSRFKKTGAFLHHSVVKEFLKKMIEVRFAAYSSRAKKRVERGMLYRESVGNHRFLFREGFLYDPMSVRKDMEMSTSTGKRSNKPLVLSESSASAVIASAFYKNVVPTILRYMETCFRMKHVSSLEEYSKIETLSREIADPGDLVMYLLGGSAMPSSQSGSKVRGIALEDDATGYVLRLTEGQESIPASSQGSSKQGYAAAVNYQISRLVANGRPVGIFLNVKQFFKDNKDLIVEFQTRMRKEYEIDVTHEDLYGGEASTNALLFMAYVFLDKVVFQSGMTAPPKQKNDFALHLETMLQKAKLGGIEEEDLVGSNVDGLAVETDVDADNSTEEVTYGEDLSKSVYDFRNNAHHLAHWQRMFTVRESILLCYCERNVEGYKLRKLVVDKEDVEPFEESVPNEVSGKINSGNAVYNIHSMRESLLRPDHFQRYLVEDVGATDHDNKDGLGSTEQGENRQTSALPSLTMAMEEILNEDCDDSDSEMEFDDGSETASTEKPTKEKRTPAYKDIGKVCREIFAVVVYNTLSGCLRILRAGVVRKVGQDGIFKGFCAAPLPQTCLPSIFRTYPSPMGCRNLDIGPLANIANAFKAGIIARTSTSGDDPHVPQFQRHDLFQHPFLGARPCKATEETSVMTMEGFIRNHPLLRIAGNPGYAVQFAALQREKNKNVNVVSFDFGLPTGNKDYVFQQLHEFLMSVSNGREEGRATISAIFSDQHLHQIPLAIRSTTMGFLDYSETGVFDFPDTLRRILLEIKEECQESGELDVNESEVDETILLDRYYDRQKKLFDGLTETAVRVWEPSGNSTRNDWKFAIQEVILDIQATVRISLLEPHYVEMTESPILDGNGNFAIKWTPIVVGPSCLDPNVAAYDPELVVCANGSTQALEYIRDAVGFKVSLETIFKELLKRLREMSEDLLLAMGLITVEWNGIDIILDSVTGMIWCVRSCEHWLCKVYLALKHRYPQNSSSANPRSDQSHCQPLFLSKPDEDPSEEGTLFDWDSATGGSVYAVVTAMVDAFHECMTTDGANQHLDPNDVMSSVVDDGTHFIQHNATVLCYPQEKLKVEYERPVGNLKLDKGPTIRLKTPKTKLAKEEWVVNDSEDNEVLPQTTPNLKNVAKTRRRRCSAVEMDTEEVDFCAESENEESFDEDMLESDNEEPCNEELHCKESSSDGEDQPSYSAMSDVNEANSSSNGTVIVGHVDGVDAGMGGEEESMMDVDNEYETLEDSDNETVTEALEQGGEVENNEEVQISMAWDSEACTHFPPAANDVEEWDSEANTHFY